MKKSLWFLVFILAIVYAYFLTKGENSCPFGLEFGLAPEQASKVFTDAGIPEIKAAYSRVLDIKTMGGDGAFKKIYKIMAKGSWDEKLFSLKYFAGLPDKSMPLGVSQVPVMVGFWKGKLFLISCFNDYADPMGGAMAWNNVQKQLQEKYGEPKELNAPSETDVLIWVKSHAWNKDGVRITLTRRYSVTKEEEKLMLPKEHLNLVSLTYEDVSLGSELNTLSGP